MNSGLLIPEVRRLIREAYGDDPVPELNVIKGKSFVRLTASADKVLDRILGKFSKELEKGTKATPTPGLTPPPGAGTGKNKTNLVYDGGKIVFYSDEIMDKTGGEFVGIHDLKDLFPNAEHAALASFSWGIETGVTWEDEFAAIADKVMTEAEWEAFQKSNADDLAQTRGKSRETPTSMTSKCPDHPSITMQGTYNSATREVTYICPADRAQYSLKLKGKPKF